MCLKTDTILLQYTFISFSISNQYAYVWWNSIKKCFSQIVLTEMT